MKAIAYMRRSQDSGTGVSEEIQDEAIREYVERKGGTVAYWLPPDLDASSWTLNRPSMTKALKLLEEGKADTLVVAKLSRVTRRRQDWETLMALMREQGWTIKSADFDVDLSDKGGRLIAGILIDFLGFEYEEKRDSYADARANAVLNHGVHGSTEPPLGYEFSIGRTVGGEWRTHDKAGKELRGPLVPNGDAARVVAAFEARASDEVKVRAWSNVARILGVKSQGHAVTLLRKRVYLGEAKSGEYVKPDAHPAIVSEELFRRVNRQRTERSVAYAGREGALLGGKIMRCATCGYSLTRTIAKAGAHYGCKRMDCTGRASVQAHLIEPYVFLQALAWHAVQHPMHELDHDLDAAAVPVYEEELARAQAEVEAIKESFAAGKMDKLSYGESVTAARYAVSAAETALAEVEASKGWLGRSTDSVQAQLVGEGNVCKDVEAGRDFIRQMVRVTVSPVGRGRKTPLSERVDVELLTPVAAMTDEAYLEMAVTV